MPTWDELSNTLESTVDLMYSKAVTITPYTKASNLSSPVQDGSRAVVSTIGYLVSRRAAVGSSGGGGSDFLSRRAQADLLVSIRGSNVPTIRQGDHMVVSEVGDIEYEISYIEPPIHGRCLFHLLKWNP